MLIFNAIIKLNSENTVSEEVVVYAYTVYDWKSQMRRKRRPIIYIICEGKETETLYFKHFCSRNCLVDIISISSKYKAAEHLVKHAKSLISQADYYPKDGDQLWCVRNSAAAFVKFAVATAPSWTISWNWHPNMTAELSIVRRFRLKVGGILR